MTDFLLGGRPSGSGVLPVLGRDGKFRCASHHLGTARVNVAGFAETARPTPCPPWGPPGLARARKSAFRFVGPENATTADGSIFAGALQPDKRGKSCGDRNDPPHQSRATVSAGPTSRWYRCRQMAGGPLGGTRRRRCNAKKSKTKGPFGNGDRN